jgi:acyl-CoA synthetase (AMP-forming)/AMP-acid ligase II
MSDLILGRDWVGPVHHLPGEPFGNTSSGPWTIVGSLARRAAATPHAPFLTAIKAGKALKTIAYDEAQAEVQRRTSLLATWGVRPGECVGILGRNSPEFVFAVLSVCEAGATAVLLNHQDPAPRLASRVAFTRSRFLLHEAEFGDLVRACTSLERPCSFEEFHREAWSQTSVRTGLPLPNPTDGALIFFTSGTTGAPKAVVQSHFAVGRNAASLAEHHQIGPGRRFLCVLPLHHVNGLEFTIFAVMMGGGHTVLCSGFDALHFWKILREHGVHVVSLVPNVLRLLAENSRLGVDNRSSLQYAVSAAAPLSVETAARVWERLRLRIMQGYGLSEVVNFSCLMPASLSDLEYQRWMLGGRRTCVGPALPGQEVAVQGENGFARPGVEGEILIRGHCVMSGYLDNEAATTEAFRGGWFHTGDLGYYAESEGGRKYIHISGRLREIAKRSGAMVNLLELDELLASIPGVRDAGCAAFANRWVDEEIGAVIVAEPGRPLTEEAILADCRRLLPFAETPKSIRFVEEIPRTATGKIRRAEIAESFAHLSERLFVEDRSKGLPEH